MDASAVAQHNTLFSGNSSHNAAPAQNGGAAAQNAGGATHNGGSSTAAGAKTGAVVGSNAGSGKGGGRAATGNLAVLSPDLPAVNETLLPEQAVWSIGLVVTVGPAFTVSAAAAVVAVPQVLVKRARYRLPFCDPDAANASVMLVAPGMLLKVEPPSLLTCH